MNSRYILLILSNMRTNTESILNDNYKKYHRPEYIDPDPLLFPKRYTDNLDIEAAAFIAASFALGRVGNIINFLERIFDALGNPYKGLVERSPEEIRSLFSGFKYRFYSSADISQFMLGLRRIYTDYGSIENCFMEGYSSERSVIAGLISVANTVNREGCGRNIVSNPECGSACKRLFLFLRWVVRKDEIDPGFWKLSPSELLIPLDTHIMKVGQYLGLSSRRTADIKTAREITENLKLFDKEDPVKYDFSMSRIGIHPDLSYADLENNIGFIGV